MPGAPGLTRGQKSTLSRRFREAHGRKPTAEEHRAMVASRVYRPHPPTSGNIAEAFRAIEGAFAIRVAPMFSEPVGALDDLHALPEALEWWAVDGALTADAFVVLADA